MGESTGHSSPKARKLSGEQASADFIPTDTFNGWITSKTSVLRTWTDSTSGSKNPNYRAQILRLNDATTAASGSYARVNSALPYMMEVEGRTLDNPPVSQRYLYHRHYKISGESYPHALCVVQLPPGSGHPSEASADNQAIEKLYQTLIGFESAVLAGEDLGEIGQTIKMLRSPMQSARKLATDLLSRHERALSQRTLSRTVKALADTTLEYRFGVMPLVHSAASAAFRLRNREYLWRTHGFSCQGRGESYSYSYGSSIGLSAATIDLSAKTRRTTTVRYKGVFGIRASVPKRPVQDILRLRMKDIIPTVWNLIPYSWLADYATNIGVIADSISVPWAGVRWCAKTTRITWDREVRGSGRKAPNWPIIHAYKVSPGGFSSSGVRWTRVRQDTMPRPSLEVSLNFSGRQMQNVAALIASRIPVLRAKTAAKVQAYPSLPQAFRSEMRSRGQKVPYPQFSF